MTAWLSLRTTADRLGLADERTVKKMYESGTFGPYAVKCGTQIRVDPAWFTRHHEPPAPALSRPGEIERLLDEIIVRCVEAQRLVGVRDGLDSADVPVRLLPAADQSPPFARTRSQRRGG